jgi:hypothetical protein
MSAMAKKVIYTNVQKYAMVDRAARHALFENSNYTAPAAARHGRAA